MPAPRDHVIRKVTLCTYKIRFRDGTEIEESFDHRLDMSEIMALMSKYPDAFYNPTPKVEQVTYRMPLSEFIRLADRIDPTSSGPPDQTSFLDGAKA